MVPALHESPDSLHILGLKIKTVAFLCLFRQTFLELLRRGYKGLVTPGRKFVQIEFGFMLFRGQKGQIKPNAVLIVVFDNITRPNRVVAAGRKGPALQRQEMV